MNVAPGGPVSNIGTGLVVAAALLSLEAAATLLGYFLVGRYFKRRFPKQCTRPANAAVDPSALRLRF